MTSRTHVGADLPEIQRAKTTYTRKDPIGSAQEREASLPRKEVKDLALINWSSVRLAAFRITRNVTASHDIAQNVCTRLRKFPRETLEAIECLQEFAAQAARSEARNWQRERSRPVSANQLTEVDTDEPGDRECGVGSEDEFLGALAKLPERERVPFLLCKVMGYSAEQAAEELGISVETAWKRLQKAFETLIKARFQTSLPRRSGARSLFNRKEL